RFVARALRRSPSCRRPARRSVQDYFSCDGTGSAPCARVRLRGPRADQAGCPSPPGSGRARILKAGKLHAVAAAGSFPAWCVPALLESQIVAARARAGSLPQSTALHAAVLIEGVRSQCVCAKGALPPQPQTPARACTRSKEEGRRRSI